MTGKKVWDWEPEDDGPQPEQEDLRRLQGCFPLILAAASVCLLLVAPLLSTTGSWPPAGEAAVGGGIGLVIAVFFYAGRPGRPWVTLLALVTAAEGIGASYNFSIDLERFLTVLLIVFGLVAVMTSLRRIMGIIAESPGVRANAIVVATGLALLVAIGGPALYEVLRLGQAAEVRNGAESVAASLVASALFFAFSSPADRPTTGESAMRPRLRPDRPGVEQRNPTMKAKFYERYVAPKDLRLDRNNVLAWLVIADVATVVVTKLAISSRYSSATNRLRLLALSPMYCVVCTVSIRYARKRIHRARQKGRLW